MVYSVVVFACSNVDYLHLYRCQTSTRGEIILRVRKQIKVFNRAQTKKQTCANKPTCVGETIIPQQRYCSYIGEGSRACENNYNFLVKVMKKYSAKPLHC
jgi:hypothetical protein